MKFRQVYVSRKKICWKILEQIVIGIAYPHVFLITMHERETAVETYLEPLQSSMIQVCKGSKYVSQLQRQYWILQ